MSGEETSQEANARLKREAAEADLAKRKEAGKGGHLWRVTVKYNLDAVETSHYIDNRFWQETIAIRERMFTAGLMVPYDPGTWLVIPPREIIAVFITQQQNYFEW